jgi:hypothetical protein
MSWIKTAWQVFFKKDIFKQDKVNPNVINAFAKMLADAIKFDKVLNGKIAWMDKIDYWAIVQILNLFVGLFAAKVKPTFWTSIEQFLIYYTDRNYDRASYILSHEINSELKGIIAKDTQDLIIHRQLSLIFEVSMMYLPKEGALNA